MVYLKHLLRKTRGRSSTNHKGELLHPLTFVHGLVSDHSKNNSCVYTAKLNKRETQLYLPFLQFHRRIIFLRHLYMPPGPVRCARFDFFFTK